MISGLITKAVTANPALAPWAAGFQALWPVIWRLALAAAVFWAGWHYGGKKAEADLEAFKVSQAEAQVAAVQQLNDEVARRDRLLFDKEAEYAKNMADLISEQSKRPPRVVRVCPDPRPRPVPSVPGASAVAAGDSGGSGGLRDGTGYDLGPGLDSLAKRANRLRLKCLAQQDRADALANQKPYTITVNR